MPDIDTFTEAGSKTKDIGFPASNPTGVTSWTLQINATEERPWYFLLRVSTVTLRRPSVSFPRNPVVQGLGRYSCEFVADSLIDDFSGADVLSPSGSHFGKLFHGLEIVRHLGDPSIGESINRTYTEDVLRDRSYCGAFTPAYSPSGPGRGLVRGVLVMNPGWQYRHEMNGMASMSFRMPRLLTSQSGMRLTTRTIVEIRSSAARFAVPTPNGPCDYNHVNLGVFPDDPRLREELRLRQVGLQVGSEIGSGLCLCHTGYLIPLNTLSLERVALESKFSIYAEAGPSPVG